MIRTLLLASHLLLLGAGPVWGQGDLPAERSSLEGISSLAAEVTVEGPTVLVASEPLVSGVLTRRVRERLRERGVPLARDRDDGPFLSVHVNVMQLENGLVPFSIELALYQEVLLARNRTRMAAETWNESVLGIVSRDRVDVVGESVDELIDQFAQDFHTSN